MAHGFKHLGMGADSQGRLEGPSVQNFGFMHQGSSPENLFDSRFNGLEVHSFRSLFGHLSLCESNLAMVNRLAEIVICPVAGMLAADMAEGFVSVTVLPDNGAHDDPAAPLPGDVAVHDLVIQVCLYPLTFGG